ncbi:MAG: leucine-rich repeat protein, partial [Eubacterium sp.]|nr:leucine-rich repeat protein [Eubacterium sp.]
LTGCQKGKVATQENTNTATSAAVESVSETSLKERESKDTVYVKRNRYPGEASYRSKNDLLGIYVYNITDTYADLVYSENNLPPFYARAEKTGENKYEFSFDIKDTKDYNLGVQKKDGELKASLMILPDRIDFSVKGISKVTDFLFTGSSTLEKKKENKQVEVLDLFNCLKDYKQVHSDIYERDRRLLEVGKERNKKRVSYLDVSISNELFLNDPEEISLYQLGDINFLSSKEQCDKAFGQPIRKSEAERIYSYKDKYVIHLNFAGNYMTRMGIYLGSREEAMKEYKIGDFQMRGCRIIHAQDCYRKGGKVTIPKDTVAIGEEAFSAIDKHTDDGYELISSIRKIAVKIPKDVYLERQAFSTMGSADVTFEEGRSVIERGAFTCAGIAEDMDIKITLPSTVKVLQEEAFYHDLSSHDLQINLNEGLDIVEDRALAETTCDLPSTIRVLGKSALYRWQPASKLKLPDHLEEIGDFCMCFTAEYAEKMERVKIPASVKKIGMNPVSYEYTGPGVDVDPANPNFNSNKKGWVFSKDGKNMYHRGDYSGDVIIPEGVENIYCDMNIDPHGEGSTTEVVFPKSLKKNYYVDYWTDDSE